jgi:hypothetical protein
MRCKAIFFFTAIEPDYASDLYEALTKRVELGGPEPMQVEPAELKFKLE